MILTLLVSMISMGFLAADIGLNVGYLTRD